MFFRPLSVLSTLFYCTKWSYSCYELRRFLKKNLEEDFIYLPKWSFNLSNYFTNFAFNHSPTKRYQTDDVFFLAFKSPSWLDVHCEEINDKFEWIFGYFVWLQWSRKHYYLDNDLLKYLSLEKLFCFSPRFLTAQKERNFLPLSKCFVESHAMSEVWSFFRFSCFEEWKVKWKRVLYVKMKTFSQTVVI